MFVSLQTARRKARRGLRFPIQSLQTVLKGFTLPQEYANYVSIRDNLFSQKSLYSYDCQISTLLYSCNYPVWIIGALCLKHVAFLIHPATVWDSGYPPDTTSSRLVSFVPGWFWAVFRRAK